jgi:hypothetical protein
MQIRAAMPACSTSAWKFGTSGSFTMQDQCRTMNLAQTVSAHIAARLEDREHGVPPGCPHASQAPLCKFAPSLAPTRRPGRQRTCLLIRPNVLGGQISIAAPDVTNSKQCGRLSVRSKPIIAVAPPSHVESQPMASISAAQSKASCS